MATEEAKAISLKALVDKENNRVIFAESDVDFTDVLFSFLTMPMGTIIRLISNHNQPPTVEVGCMKNLYESIKNLDMQYFRTEACKTMLLCPRNAAAPQNKRLKLQIGDGELPSYFLCDTNCTVSGHKLLSLYPNAVCECGQLMNRMIELSEKTVQKLVFDARDRGVFVKGLTQFIISDELQVKPSSREASLSIMSKLGLMDCSAMEEYNIDIGVDEVLTLLKCSMVSKKPLTETLLKRNSAPKFGVEDFDQNIYVESTVEEPESNVVGKIHVKLIVSKSKKMVCCAEASEEFVDLVFSFLTVPLGYIIKEMQSSISKGSLTNLYNSVQELDADKYLKSNEHKEMLISPKLAPGFSYENHPLGIKECLHPTYSIRGYNGYNYRMKLTSDGEIPSVFPSTSDGETSISDGQVLTIKDPKSHFKEATRGGFVVGPAMFTVTDNLIIAPMSQVQSLSLLNKLKVPLCDTEEFVVHVDSAKALRLLIASFVSESALTNTFLRELNPEQSR